MYKIILWRFWGICGWNYLDDAGSNRQTERQKEEEPKSDVENESSSDYEEVEGNKTTSKAQTLPAKLQPSCMKSGKMVNFGPVTPEFTRVVGVNPSLIGSGVSLATFTWRRQCGDQC